MDVNIAKRDTLFFYPIFFFPIFFLTLSLQNFFANSSSVTFELVRIPDNSEPEAFKVEFSASSFNRSSAPFDRHRRAKETLLDSIDVR